MIDSNEKDVLFICACGDTEHQLIMRYFGDDDDPEVYVSVHLTPEYKWWKRVILGIKYIFGYRSKYGEFDEFIFKPNDYEKLQGVVDFLKEAYEKLKKE